MARSKVDLPALGNPIRPKWAIVRSSENQQNESNCVYLVNKNCLCRFQDCGKLLARWRTQKKLEKYAKAAISYNQEKIEIVLKYYTYVWTESKSKQTTHTQKNM